MARSNKRTFRDNPPGILPAEIIASIDRTKKKNKPNGEKKSKGAKEQKGKEERRKWKERNKKRRKKREQEEKESKKKRPKIEYVPQGGKQGYRKKFNRA